MAKELRRVTVTLPRGMKEGHFHRWGNFAHHTDSGIDIQVTKGIVEIEGGTMVTVDVQNIRFV